LHVSVWVQRMGLYARARSKYREEILARQEQDSLDAGEWREKAPKRGKLEGGAGERKARERLKRGEREARKGRERGERGGEIKAQALEMRERGERNDKERR
jgi:hypothetical protein